MISLVNVGSPRQTASCLLLEHRRQSHSILGLNLGFAASLLCRSSSSYSVSFSTSLIHNIDILILSFVVL